MGASTTDGEKEGKKWANPQKTKEEGGKEQTIRTARRQRHGGVAN